LFRESFLENLDFTDLVSDGMVMESFFETAVVLPELFLQAIIVEIIAIATTHFL
jgi:hypothetical protein